MPMPTITCGNHSCSKHPSYGVDGCNRREFCSEHRTDGMVDLKSKRCAHHDCNKLPFIWYGW